MSSCFVYLILFFFFFSSLLVLIRQRSYCHCKVKDPLGHLHSEMKRSVKEASKDGCGKEKIKTNWKDREGK